MSKMRVIPIHRAPWKIGALAVVVAALLTFPGAATAQLPGLGEGSSAPSGTSGTALIVTVLGSTTALASTGNLANAYDAVGAELDSGSLPVGNADALHGAAIGSGDYGYVTSDASLGDLVLSVAGAQITATSAYATALADGTSGTSGWSTVDGLAVNGTSVVPTGEANQTIDLGVIKLVLNEITQSGSGIVVNALHVTSLDGTVDVVVASASAVSP